MDVTEENSCKSVKIPLKEGQPHTEHLIEKNYKRKKKKVKIKKSNYVTVCYNCTCDMPGADMGKGHAGADPNGKAITDLMLVRGNYGR